MASIKVYQIITDQVVNRLQDAIKQAEEGKQAIAPWNRPWYKTGMPANLITKKPYRGINVFLTAFLGFQNPYFLSFKQLWELGGRVKQDENGQMMKPFPIVFWNWVEVSEDQNGKKLEQVKKIPFLRYYSVFNVDQVSGIEKHIPKIGKRKFNPIEDAEKIIKEMPNPPIMKNEGKQAFYRPSNDTITIPEHEYFKSNEAYYSTMFHEMIHSTGHEKRLSRKEITNIKNFGSHSYSTEELVAEMGAVFLCNECGINATFENSLAYLKSWLSKLQDDPKMVVTAGGKAQKAVDHILNVKWEKIKKEKSQE